MLRLLVLTIVASCAFGSQRSAWAQAVGASRSSWSSRGTTESSRNAQQGLTGSDWSSIWQAYLKASNTEGGQPPSTGGDRFGTAVAVSGNTIVVGAPDEDSTSTGVNGDQGDNSSVDAGAAYVFVRNGTTWTQQAYLKASNTDAGDRFGNSLALSGDTLVVGAGAEDSGATGVNGSQSNNSSVNAGAAYVFVRNGASWTQQAYLKASNTNVKDRFGDSVAVSGNTIVVGAHQEDGDATGTLFGAKKSGAVYVFVRSGTTWAQQAYLKASNVNAGDDFGRAVAVSGNIVAIGASNEDSSATGVDGDQSDNSASDAGAAYIFVQNGTTWNQQAYLKASNTDASDKFGWSVTVSSDTVAIGAINESSSATGVDGNQINNSALSAGAVYVFVQNGSDWTQQAYLKASNTDANDVFSSSVAVSGNTIFIGAPREDSSALGVNGDMRNDDAKDSGAVYAFVRTGSTWRGLAYLKASNTGGGVLKEFLGDAFGSSVSVSGNTLVVGAPTEDSSATGVDGNQDDNSALHSGAAYVFRVPGWFDMGCALSGVFGDPQLVGSGTLLATSSNALQLTNAAAMALASLFVAPSSTALPFKGGTLKPNPFLPPSFYTTDASGTLTVPFHIGPNLPAGSELWVQWGIQDAAAVNGVALSNAVLGVTP